MATRKCNVCYKEKDLNEKEFKPRGSGFGKTCRVCTNKYYPPKKSSDKENERVNNAQAGAAATPDGDPDNEILMGLPVLDLDAFLGVVAQSAAHLSTLEARVKISADMVEGVMDLKESANKLVEQINDRMKYRFTPHSRYDHKKACSTRFMYHCAQSKTRQHDTRKAGDEKKHRDKESMTAFECNGWLHVTLYHGDPVALIKIRHEEEHVPYWSIDVPPEVKAFVKENVGLSAPELWNEILKKYPTPNFSRKSIYSVWYEESSKQWKRDEDELESAKKLMKEASVDESSSTGSRSFYQVEPIPLPEMEGFTAVAFALPNVLRKWGGRLRELSLDSAWNTNKSGYEVYALLGEIYGSGCPLGYLLLQSSGEGIVGGKEKYIASLLSHFKTQWEIKPLFTLTDKDWSEINACQSVFSDAKHQLCFWHCLRAIYKRLCVLGRRPKFYDSLEAFKEFSFVDPTFVPIGQLTPDLRSQPIPGPSQKATPRLTVLLNGVRQNGAPEAPPPQPRLVLRLNGVVQSFCNLPKNINYDERVSTDDEDEGEDIHTREDSDDLDAQLDRFMQKGTEEDQEDGPDWMFDPGEERAKDPAYIFCPAPHRKALLHLFTKHFCQHPAFPERAETTNGTWDSCQIRRQAVWEMYDFCYRRSLREVWGYMWANWYSPKTWVLWARSTSDRVSRLRTTMNVENFWRQLKHDYLHRAVHPRLDRLVWTLIHKVTPAFYAQAEVLDDTHRLGRSKPLTTYQKYFKTAWKELAGTKVSGKVYKTDVAKWTCTCGRQKYQPHHLCKHLVQMVPEPPANFWREVVRRRTLPLYQHPALGSRAGGPGTYGRVDGSISDGDDHIWLGDKSVLRGKGTRDGLILTKAALSESSLGKRKAVEEEPLDEANSSEAKKARQSDDIDDAPMIIDLTMSSPPSSSSPLGYGSEDEEELDTLCRKMRTRAEAFRRASEIYLAQADCGESSRMWMKSQVDRKVGEDVALMVGDIERYTGTAKTRDTTWAMGRGKKEQRRMKNTMGYQL